jgi:hypothetical protein
METNNVYLVGTPYQLAPTAIQFSLVIGRVGKPGCISEKSTPVEVSGFHHPCKHSY